MQLTPVSESEIKLLTCLTTNGGLPSSVIGAGDLLLM